MKKIYRSTRDHKIAGICGGLGEMYNLDPTIVRLIVVFLTVATGFLPGAAAYCVGWFLIPHDIEIQAGN